MKNWKALQAYNCLKADFNPPTEINITHMGGGTWRANLHKEGVKHVPSHGGARKRTGRAKLRYVIGRWKPSIFSPAIVPV